MTSRTWSTARSRSSGRFPAVSKDGATVDAEGFVYVIDRTNGKLLSAEPIGRAKNASAKVAKDCSVEVVGSCLGKKSVGNTNTAAVA